MIYKCPNCADALYYEPEENCLVCRSCDSRFQPEELDEGKYPKMRMDFHIYSCTACGAEIMVTPTETATYCVYCGQPVIVFDRVSSELKPDYVVPFKVTKRQAEYNIRQKIKKNPVVPKEFKDFKVDTLRGIYIPYWLYDFDYYDTQYYEVSRKVLGGMTQSTRGYFKEAQVYFRDLPTNASSVLDDKELQSLGKFDFREMLPFSPSYLSGFYADRYDIDFADAAEYAVYQAQQIFDYHMQNDLYKKGYETAFMKYKSPRVVAKSVSYLLLPVWFMTCQYEGRPYTILVNGQTGVVAGNLPIHKLKAWRLFGLCTAAISPIFLLFVYLWNLAYTQNQLTWVGILGMVIFNGIATLMGVTIGRVHLYQIKKAMQFSRSKHVGKYIKERQAV